MPSACYIYAIVQREAILPTGLAGVARASLFSIPWRALAAAACYVDDARLQPTPDNLLHHEAVVEALCRAGPALPARFGTVLSDPGAVASSITERYSVLVDDLARLGGKVELGLTVLWDAEQTLPDCATRSRTCSRTLQGARGPSYDECLLPTGSVAPQTAPRTLKGAATGAAGAGAGTGAAGETAADVGPGTRYLMARLAEDRQQSLMQSQANALARELDAAFREHILASQHRVLPIPRLALRMAYLLEPRRIGAFRNAFELVRLARPELRFLLTGPWPPYSFVTPPEGALAAATDTSATSLATLGRLLWAGVSGHTEKAHR
ncbi:MAG: GvpL/GvpF family gas vesicle protein [Chloroflexi bacterium]|nr:GvpL/GvpF family gas vesicle protein [Chloroflexota bacterium]